MQDITDNLNGLKGVQAVALVMDEETISSTFAEEKKAALLASAEMIREYFAATESLEKDYHEIFFSLPDSYLVAFFMADDLPLILLKINKRVNLPLINMGVKAAIVKLKKQSLNTPLLSDEPDLLETLSVAAKQSELVTKTPATSQRPPATIDAKLTPTIPTTPSIKPTEANKVLTNTKPLVSIVPPEDDDEAEQPAQTQAHQAEEREILKKPNLHYHGVQTDNTIEVTAVEEKPKKRSFFSWGRKKQPPVNKEKEAAANNVMSHLQMDIIKVTSQEGINALQQNLSNELINHLGPAAGFVFQDAVDEWKGTYLQKTANLGYLVEIVLKELETPQEKQAYKKAARKILSE
ncbi:MAG TPA: hypothetical protein ENK78_06120 [Thiothrix sp.]|nr:hypothetical protein [Thiothrix sp.]